MTHTYMNDLSGVSRVSLRIEWADGSVRRIEAEFPIMADLKVALPEPLFVRDLDPYVIEAAEPVSVEFELHGSPAHPITMSCYDSI